MNAFETSGTFIGHRAGIHASGQQNAILIGTDAGSFSFGGSPGGGDFDTKDTIAIGRGAASHTEGESAPSNGPYGRRFIAVGMYAGSGAVGFEEDVFLGHRAGAKANENGYSVLIGSEAGYNLQNGSITIPRYRAGIGIGL